MNNIDNEEKLFETATKYYNNYGKEDFSFLSSKSGTESDNNDGNSSSNSGTDNNKYTLYDEDDRAMYNELCKLEKKIEDLKTMYEADPEGNKHLRAYFKNCDLNKNRVATEMLRIIRRNVWDW